MRGEILRLKRLSQLFILIISVIAFAVVPIWAGVKKQSSDEGAERMKLFARIFQQEEALDHRILEITGNGSPGLIDKVKDEIKGLEKTRRLNELRVKWLIICPASFCINFALAASGLANWAPPTSTALSAAIGTFGMVYVFDATDKYWNRVFNEQIANAVSAFDAEATKILREDDLDRAYSQEVDFARLERAGEYLDRAEAREKQLLKAMQKALADAIRKQNEESLKTKALSALGKKQIKDPEVIKAIEEGEKFEEKELGGIRNRFLYKRMQIAYHEKVANLLQQRLRLIKSLRAKIEYGDNRFQKLRGSDRAACMQLLQELSSGPRSETGA